MVQPQQVRIIAFDVDGVIIQGFWLSRIIARLGPLKAFVFGVLGILYEARLMGIASFMRFAYRLLKGAPKDWLIRMTDQVYFFRGVKSALKILKNQGHIIVLLSSGIPDFVVAQLAITLGAHYAAGIRVEVRKGFLTGHIAALDCRGQSKVEALKDIIEAHKLYHHEIVAIANDRNNIPLFQFAHLAVGFRPDQVVRRHVRRVITTPDLRALLPVVALPPVRLHVPRRLSQEIIRQLLHASAVIIPILWLWDSSWHVPIYFLIGSLTLLFAFSEILRRYGIQIPVISKMVLAAGREDEIDRFVLSPLYFAAGVIFPFLIFGTLLNLPHIAAASVTAFLIGDAFSTIGGIFFGRHYYPFNPRKTLEGTLIGFSVAFIVLLFIISPTFALLSAIIAAIIELLPLPIDDNLAVPILTALLLLLFSFIGFR
ncbi:MAG: haloacid dehalogenase-like hydrolase [Candidatus Hodarchaeota archaeon]